MRTIFPGQFRPTAAGFKQLWSDCIFAVDANVLLNLYRYSPDTRQELEKSLKTIKDRIFIPHQAAKEFLKNRLGVTAGQAEEYTRTIKAINELSATLSNKKKHPFLPEADLPHFKNYVDKLVLQLETQRSSLLDRMASDEVLDFVESIFNTKTGLPLIDEDFQLLIADGEKRYQSEIPPGYKDGKKDASGEPYRKFGDLIVWRQLLNKAKSSNKSLIFITDDKKEDWWLEQSGKTIGPRTELREEFIKEVSKDFWMYTVDKFLEESAKTRNTPVNQTIIAEVIEVRREAKTERIEADYRSHGFRYISKNEMIERLSYSEKWAAENSEGFLGLNSYIKHYLGNAGFDYSSSYDVLRELEDEGLVEIYEHRGQGHERSVKAIRLIKNSPPKNTPLADIRSLINTQQVSSEKAG